jgi:hypothetical protein
MKLTVLALVILACSGCVTMSITAPDGATFTRSAFGVNPTFGALTVEKRPDASYKMTVRGLDSNSTDAVAVAVTAAIQAMSKAAP